MTKQADSAIAQPTQTPNYNITVVGRHVDVTEGMKNHAIDKVSKIDKFSDRIIDVTIRMDIQKLDHKCDLILQVDHIKIKSSAVTNDMYISVDRAVEKLQRQLVKYRKRIQDHAAKKLSVVDMNVNVIKAPTLEEEINEQIEEQNNTELFEQYQPHEIVKQKTVPLKTLTRDEAIMKMELSEDSFMIFRSEEDLKLKVIYRREDLNFGIIEVEA